MRPPPDTRGGGRPRPRGCGEASSGSLPPVGRASSVARRAVEVDGRGRPPVRAGLLEGAPVWDEGKVGELTTAEDAALIAPLACSAAPGAGGMRALVAEFDADDPGHGCSLSDREYTASFAALSGMVDPMDASNPVARTSNPTRQS